MSGFYLLGLIAIWLFVGWLIYRFWRYVTPTSKSNKLLYYVFGGVLFLIWFGSAFWPFAGKKMYYDAQVREMCAKDGGITVYETVELPAEMFNRWGQINFFKPTGGEDALGTEYKYISSTLFLKRGEHFEVSILRHQRQIYRRSDNKLLGEQVSYSRRGGDLPGFWHPSSYRCQDSNGKSLLDSLFTKR
ncbi:MAG: hypothetical protein KZQ99_22845 [Candidatus Thiodiazotropha sp. (ex Dulcina madagascariensis)]|nr:hypothetical protein [Candidatus Thiodiazotropha sp. (ex Dulcina madagascariensis)]